MAGVIPLGMLTALERAQSYVVGAARAVGPRRALLGIGFVGVAMGATACSDGGTTTPTACVGTPSGSLAIIPPGTTVGSGLTKSTIAFKSSTCPSVVGQQVAFTVTLTPDPSATVPPTGTVSVGLNNGQGNVPFAGCDSLPLAVATDGTNTFTSTCTTTFTGANSSTNVVAGYSGDSVFAPNAAVLVQQVNKAATTTTITSSSFNPSVAGQPVTLTATVSANPPGAGTPTGAVAFSDGNGNPITCTGGSQTLDSKGNGAVTCATSALPAGSPSITAAYQGDANFAQSTSAAFAQTVGQTAGQAPATATLTSSANPSVFGQSTVTASVAPVDPASGTPIGNVVFTVDNAPLPAVPLSGSKATLPGSTLGVGTHVIFATYQGDTAFAASPPPHSPTQTVTQAPTTTTLTSSADPSVVGQPVTVTATVAPVAPSAGPQI